MLIEKIMNYKNLSQGRHFNVNDTFVCCEYVPTVAPVKPVDDRIEFYRCIVDDISFPDSMLYATATSEEFEMELLFKIDQFDAFEVRFLRTGGYFEWRLGDHVSVDCCWGVSMKWLSKFNAKPLFRERSYFSAAIEAQMARISAVFDDPPLSK